MTKKELIKTLENFKDTDQIIINIHDTVFYEDNYDFTIQSIEIDKQNTEIQICPVHN